MEEQNRDSAIQITRYLSGEMNEKERYAFEKELSRDPDLSAEFNTLSKLYESVDLLTEGEAYNLDEEWNRIASKIDFQEENPGRKTERSWLLRIAAILLIGLAGIAGWFISRDMTDFDQVVTAEESTILETGDGSVITLNGGTRVKYSIGEDTDTRKVILKGEAYFEVARDTARPFIIEAGSAIIQVLGTEFNVLAGEKGELVEVTVKSGLVSMETRGKSGNRIILHPGNSGVYDHGKKELRLMEAADPNAAAWKTRELIFSDTPLREVVSTINHVYGSQLFIETPEIMECPITVSFRDQELSDVLEVVTSTMDLELVRKDNGVALSGPGCE